MILTNSWLELRGKILLAVNVAASTPFSDISSLAIAIAGSKVTTSEDGRHLGIFFRSEDEPLQLIHMAWHDALICEEPNSDYCWIPCSSHIDPVILDTIADWLATVYKVNGSTMPYSIKSYLSDPFDEKGKLVARELGDGLTCSTFVMWVFHHSYIELLNKNSWKDRPDDKLWRQSMINLLLRTRGYAKKHIEAQNESVSSELRYRPEEVAGAAATFTNNPIDFDQAIELGENVVFEMTKKNML